MTFVAALRHNGRWRLRFAIFLALIVPFYVVPVLLRWSFSSHLGWTAGALLSDLAGCCVVGLLTNNYRLGVVLYFGTTVIELLLVALGGHTLMAMLAGDLFPALVATYFAQQLYINMGD